MTVHPVCLPSEIPDDIDKWEGRLIDIGKKLYKRDRSLTTVT